MQNLFTPAGDTDPVRGYHDGAMLHILRHYPVDRVIVFLTQEMEHKEKTMQCYTRGIRALNSTCSIEFIRSGITDPQNYESLTQMQEAFDACQEKYPGDTWLLNISSGTPQIKNVMAMLSLDYPNTKAIQVTSPERKSNRSNHPCETVEELVDMLEVNEDNEPGAPNRCVEPPLLLLKRFSVKKQILSLVGNYEYGGALQLASQYKMLVPETTMKLLQHACYRLDLQWKQANQVIAQYKGKTLLQNPDTFSEYFQLMELRQRKGQLPDFIIKISPILVEIGRKYVDTLPGFSLANCGREGKNGFWLMRSSMEQNYPELVQFMDYGREFRDTNLYFWFFVDVCQFYKGKELLGNERHEKITERFGTLRKIEECLRNGLAHEITNLTEKKIQAITQKSMGKAYQSSDIVRLLQETLQLTRGRKVPWTYDFLNRAIEDSLRVG